MDDRILPRYPVYVISKGRHDNGLTAKFLLRDKVPFKIVVEPQESEQYAAAFGAENMLVLPFSNLGLGGIPARNWCWEHSISIGAKRHWILDDNIRQVKRFYKGKRIPCESGPAFAAIEDFTDRYENLWISGMNYTMFGYPKLPPFFLNVHVYSCLLIQNDIPHRWRGRYNEDTDLCLQVLSSGKCTALFNAFLIEKMASMVMKGGNTDQLYKGDGRLKMARSLERVWPHVVGVDRRFKRPQHVVSDSWRKFDTPLKLKDGIDLNSIKPNEYGLRLTAQRRIKSGSLREFAEQHGVTDEPPEARDPSSRSK
jgi:hypothetical protein